MGSIKSKDNLSKEDLNFLMGHTHMDEKAIKDWYTGFRRDCPSGRLMQQQLFDMYKIFSPGGDAAKFCTHVFRVFDTDKNGYIDFIEFLLAINITSAGTPKEKLKWAFKLYDVDGNGVIDQYEMTKVVQSIYEMLGSGILKPTDTAKERAKKIFIKLDQDGDCRLTEEEFVTGLLENDDLRNLLTPVAVRGPMANIP